MDKSKNEDNDVLNMNVNDLRNSPHPEDHEMAKTCAQILEIIIKKIKPILRYICKLKKFQGTCEIRCLPVGNFKHTDYDYTVFLSRDGNFFATYHDNECKYLRVSYTWRSGDIEEIGGNKVWTHVPFFELFYNIKAAIDPAEKNRQKHLVILEKRKKLLEEILKTIEIYGA